MKILSDDEIIAAHIKGGIEVKDLKGYLVEFFTANDKCKAAFDTYKSVKEISAEKKTEIVDAIDKRAIANNTLLVVLAKYIIEQEGR